MKNQYSGLIRKARRNDEKAIRELYDLTIRKMTFIARKYLREDMVDDVLQISYVKAFKSLDQLKDPDKFDKWLGMIVARNCKNELARRKDISFTEIEKDDYGFDESIENTYEEFKPDSEASYNELRETISNILNELKTEQRICILMFYYQELSIKEISKILEVNENTVKSRLNLAKKKMAEKIAALETKGYKIKTIAPIPLLIWALKQEESQMVLSTGTGVATSILSGMKSSGTALKTSGISIKTKVIAGTVAATGVAGAGYYVYDQNRTIDVTENIQYEVKGANHYGTIEVIDNEIENINVNDLIDGYEYSSNGTLKNGDIITITVNYDQEYVSEHSLKIKNSLKEITINGLKDRYNGNDLDDEFLQHVHKAVLTELHKKYPKDYGGYVIRLDDKEIEDEYYLRSELADYSKNVYYDVISSYLQQSIDLNQNTDKYVMLLRQSYYDYEEDKKYSNILEEDGHFLYCDYYIAVIDDFYVDSKSNESDIIKSIESIDVMSTHDLGKPSNAKKEFKNCFDNDNYKYIMIKNILND